MLCDEEGWPLCLRWLPLGGARHVVLLQLDGIRDSELFARGL
jgi:hypothetical protein